MQLDILIEYSLELKLLVLSDMLLKVDLRSLYSRYRFNSSIDHATVKRVKTYANIICTHYNIKRSTDVIKITLLSFGESMRVMSQ